MFIPTPIRREIHQYLFQQGVVVAKKDPNLKEHPELKVHNLYVIKALQSLTSKGFVKTQFSWQYYYYTLTDEGVDYLREWLSLPPHVVPGTHSAQQREERGEQGKHVGDVRPQFN